MVRQPLWAIISGILFIAVIGFVVERIVFLQKAERVSGIVTSVTSYNSRCGGGKRRRSYSCTKYNAVINYTTLQNQRLSFQVSAGSSRGHNMPLSSASKHMNQQVPVVYDPDKPSKVYEDTLFGVWGVPIMMFLIQIATFFASLAKKKGSA